MHQFRRVPRHPEGAVPTGVVPYPSTDVSVGLAPHQEGEGIQGIQGADSAGMQGIQCVDSVVSPLHAVKPSKSRRQATVQSSSEPVVPVRVDTPVTSTSTIDRPRRASVGNWKDGPAKAKDGAFQTIRDKEQKFHAKLSDVVISQDIGNDVAAMKASLSQALKDDKRRGAILKSIGAEIDNLEAPGVLKPIRYKDIPVEQRRHVIGVYMFHKEKFKADKPE